MLCSNPKQSEKYEEKLHYCDNEYACIVSAETEARPVSDDQLMRRTFVGDLAKQLLHLLIRTPFDNLLSYFLLLLTLRIEVKDQSTDFFTAVLKV